MNPISRCLTITLILICANGYAQSNAPKAAAEDAPTASAVLPACPTLTGVDEGVADALTRYCAAVLAAHKAAVDRAVTAAAAAVERDLQPQLAAAQAAHRSCTLEGAIMGAGLTLAASLLGGHLSGP